MPKCMLFSIMFYQLAEKRLLLNYRFGKFDIHKRLAEEQFFDGVYPVIKHKKDRLEFLRNRL